MLDYVKFKWYYT